MTYATLDHLIDRAGEDEILQVADRDRDDIADADVIAAALGDADDIIDGYVGTKYTLPLAYTPGVVRAWAVSIARYILHRDGAPEYVENDYKTAVAALKDLSRGLVTLPPDVGGETAASTGGVVSSSPDEVFTADKLRGW